MMNEFKRVLFAAVVAMGTCSRVGAVGQLEPGEVMAPGLYRAVVWANPTAAFPLGSDYWANNAIGNVSYLFDGMSNNHIGDTDSPKVIFMIDLGTPHTLNRFGVGGRNDAKWGWPRISNMKVAASNDGESWTDLFHLTKTDSQEVSDVFTCSAVNYYPSNDTVTKYRYVKFYNFDQQSGHISEACVYSTDVMVEAGAADPFETKSVDSGDHPDGVLLSAKLVNAPESTYDLVAYVSAEDHGDDLAAWQAAADVKSVTLGEKVIPDSFVSGRVAGLDAGRWYWRAFAVSGSTVVASDPTHPFSTGTTFFPAKAYVKTEGIKQISDGVVNKESEYGSDAWIVFDIGDIPKGKHIDSVRLWTTDTTKTGYSMRYMNNLVCDFGASTEALDWGGVVVSPDGAERVVERVASVPSGIQWTTSAEKLVNKSPYGTSNPLWLFDSDMVSTRPRYLRFMAPQIRFAELEIRLADDPGGLVAFTNDGEPHRIGTPSVPYGGGEIAPGVETRVSFDTRDVYEGQDNAQLCRLLGWTLTVTNAANEEIVTTSTDETVGVCSYTPANGDKSAALVWHWKIWSHVPAKVMKAVIDKDGNVVEKNGFIWMIDDKRFDTYPGSDSDSTDLLWDLGSPRPVSWFRFSPRNYDGRPERFNNFTVYASNDAKTWQSIYCQGGVTPDINVWHEHWFDAPQTYRYFRVGDLPYTSMSEFWLYSDGLMLKAERAVSWASEDVVDSMFDDKGITLSGKLVWAPSGSAEVTAYVADTDYEDDLDEWRRNGRAVSVGTVTSGASFTAHVANLQRGMRYWRAFATEGGQTVASSPALPCVARTKSFHPQAYVKDGVTNLDKVCDGSTAAGPDAQGWLVFDLSKIPAGHRLAAVRIHPRNNWDRSWERVVGSQIKFGYSDGTEQWNVTKVVRDATSDYPTSEASAIPENITWNEMDEVTALPVLHWMGNGDNVFELPISSNTNDLKPQYLFFSCDYMNVREVSLRLIDKTPGLVILLQ